MVKVLVLIMAIAMMGQVSAPVPLPSPTDIATAQVTTFDAQETSYHTEADFRALIGKPRMNATIGTSGQPITPDSGLSPGAIRTTDKNLVCSEHTNIVRNVPIEEKKAVYDTYSQYYTQVQYQSGNYEIDHIISLELGGSNSPSNLFPEIYNDPWGAHVKDKLENKLHDLVCSGQITLAQAQYMISTNWIDAYKTYLNP